jgi:hypothetical protein
MLDQDRLHYYNLQEIHTMNDNTYEFALKKKKQSILTILKTLTQI